MASRKMRLNDTICKGIQPEQGKQHYVLDDRQDYLGLQVNETGRKTWGLRKWHSGQPRWIKIGVFQVPPGKADTKVQMGRQEAVKKAQELVARIGGKDDPFKAKQDQAKALTLAEAFRRHQGSNPRENTQTTLDDHQKRFDAYVIPFKVNVNGVGQSIAELRLDQIESYHLDDLQGHVMKQCKANQMTKAKRYHKKAKASWVTGGKKGQAPMLKEIPESAGARTANQVLARLNTVFVWAARRNMVPSGWTIPKVERRATEAGKDESNHIRVDQLPAFYGAVEALRSRVGYKVENNNTIADAILTALWTGGRKANVLAMQWAHLDLQEGVWRIPRAEYKTKKKMDSSHKTIPIPPQAVKLLQARVGCHPKWVFPNYHGNLKHEESAPSDDHIKDLRKSWAWVKKHAGIDQRVTIHGLRHSLGTWMHQQGVNPKAIAGQLGHADLESTARYTHNEAKHLQGITGQVIDAVYEVVPDDGPGVIQAGLHEDDWRAILEAVAGTPLAARVTEATGVALLNSKGD